MKLKKFDVYLDGRYMGIIENKDADSCLDTFRKLKTWQQANVVDRETGEETMIARATK